MLIGLSRSGARMQDPHEADVNQVRQVIEVVERDPGGCCDRDRHMVELLWVDVCICGTAAAAPGKAAVLDVSA